MISFKALVAAGLLALSAGTAGAASYYADKVIDYSLGTCANPGKCKHYAAFDDRYNQAHVLGAEDGKFTSLGLGGSLVLGFSEAVFGNGDISTWDIAYGTGEQNANNGEAIHVYTLDSAQNVVEDLGILSNQAMHALSATRAFSFLRLVDVTRSVFDRTNSFDGFDVDAVVINVAPVPLPAAGGMLLAGAGSLIAVRRRKAAAAR